MSSTKPSLPPEADKPLYVPPTASKKLEADTAGLSTQDAFINDYVAARRKAWIAGNTSESPFGKSKPGEPSAQHIQTWTTMAKEELVRSGLK